jgi:uncharacterized membrane protein YfcA
MTLVQVVLGVLALCGMLLIVAWRGAASRTTLPGAVESAIGFLTNFFDTLGIGSFATTTAAFRLTRLVPDELIPGTVLVGHALPVIAQAMIFITVVDVDPVQMSILIAVCVAGGWIGAGIVASVSKRTIQLAMGTALAAASVMMLIGMLGLIPAGGIATTFAPRAFAIAIAVSVTLGALLTIGIGNYAPSLIVFSLLGMDPRAVFPIMMGSGAFVATIAGVRFVARGRFHGRAALGLTLGGIPGVLVAAWLVRSLPLAALRWVVLAVVLYSAASLLRSAMQERP